MVQAYERSHRDYFKEIGDRVEWVEDGYRMSGVITGMGFAGGYMVVRGDDGVKYEGQSYEFSKVFD